MVQNMQLAASDMDSVLVQLLSTWAERGRDGSPRSQVSIHYAPYHCVSYCVTCVTPCVRCVCMPSGVHSVCTSLLVCYVMLQYWCIMLRALATLAVRCISTTPEMLFLQCPKDIRSKALLHMPGTARLHLKHNINSCVSCCIICPYGVSA